MSTPPKNDKVGQRGMVDGEPNILSKQVKMAKSPINIRIVNSIVTSGKQHLAPAKG